MSLKCILRGMSSKRKSEKNSQLLQISPDTGWLDYAQTIPMLTNMEESTKSMILSKPDLAKEILRELINTKLVSSSVIAEVLSSPTDEVYFSVISRESAKSRIIEYINNNPGCMTSAIIEETKLDPLLTMEILKELKQENSVLSKSI